MLEIDIDHVEAGGLGEPRDLHTAREADRHRGDDFIALQLFLDHVTHYFHRYSPLFSRFQVGKCDRQHHMLRLLPWMSCASEMVTPPPSAFSMTKLNALRLRSGYRRTGPLATCLKASATRSGVSSRSRKSQCLAL